MKPSPPSWTDLGADPDPAWYLDPVVAAQKARLTLDLVHRWTADAAVATYLKTDLFEESHGADALVPRLFGGRACVIGVDVAWTTARRAAAHVGPEAGMCLASDLRRLALADGCVDAVVSTSTLDHFDAPADLRRALAEIARVLRPGGVLVVTLDNPDNLFYPLLRWASRHRRAPFPLGCTLSREDLDVELARAGLVVDARDWLIHNPRMLSTLLALGLRRLLGARADGPIRAALAAFALLGRLPTRRYSACFVAARARKPAGAEGGRG